MKAPKNAVRTVRRLSPCALAALLAMAACTQVGADTPAAATQPAEVRFNEDFLRLGNGVPLDLNRYNKGNPAEAGRYRADLYVNQVWLGRSTVTLKAIGARGGDVATCFDRDLLERVGVDLQRLSPEATALLPGAAPSPSQQDCVALQFVLVVAVPTFQRRRAAVLKAMQEAALARRRRAALRRTHEAVLDFRRGIAAHALWRRVSHCKRAVAAHCAVLVSSPGIGRSLFACLVSGGGPSGIARASG